MRLLGLLLAASLYVFPSPPATASLVTDSLTHFYASQDAAAIARLYRSAQTREERLLCSYRLFPLTKDDAWLSGIPDSDDARTARELALIAAHWAYRAANAPAWRLPTYGRRSERVLNRARALDPDEPYVLLVEGQSLLYKPAIFGGDAEEAQRRFERLRSVLRARPAPGIHPFEAEIWIWLALRKHDEPAAQAMRRQLFAQSPPPLFRQFLIDPP